MILPSEMKLLELIGKVLQKAMHRNYRHIDVYGKVKFGINTMREDPKQDDVCSFCGYEWGQHGGTDCPDFDYGYHGWRLDGTVKFKLGYPNIPMLRSRCEEMIAKGEIDRIDFYLYDGTKANIKPDDFGGMRQLINRLGVK